MNNQEFSHFYGSDVSEFKKVKKELAKYGKVSVNGNTYTSIHDVITAGYSHITDKNGKIYQLACSLSFAYSLFFENLFTHYYVETEELYEFMKQKPGFDKNVFEESIKNIQMIKINNIYSWPIFIHHRGNGRSVMVCIQKYGSQDCYHILISDGENNQIGGLNEIVEYVSKDNNTNIFLNFMLYKACFPEKITITPPKCKIEYNGGKKSYIVGESPDVIRRDGVRAHFRRGHYRLLSSDKYTHKKGQIVFISSSFVGRDKQLTIED